MYVYKYRKELKRVEKHLRDLTELQRFLNTLPKCSEITFVYPGGSEVYLFCSKDTPSKVTSHNYHTLLANPELYEKELDTLCNSKIFILDNFELKSLENHLKPRRPDRYSLGLELIERLKEGHSHIRSIGRYDVWLKLDISEEKRFTG